MSSGEQTERCRTKYCGGYSSLSPSNQIPEQWVGITTFSVQMATWDVTNWFWQHGLQIAHHIATYIISSGISVSDASVKRTNLEIMSLLTRNSPRGITTNIERSVMPTPIEPMPNCRHTMFTEDSTCFDIFLISWVTSRSPTSYIQCRSACLTTCRGGFSSSRRRTHSSTCTMQSGYPCLLTTTWHQRLSHMRKFLHWMRRWCMKLAGTCFEL